MKATKIIWALTALLVSFPLVMTGCKNDDDDKKSEISDAELELESAAFNLFRGLLSLTTDDDATNSAENKGNGIELLPENWKTQTFSNLDQALVAVEGEEGSYMLACETLDEAKDYVSSLAGEEVFSDSYSLIVPGLGSLSFAKVTGEVNCLATLDVSIPQIPSLSRIKFVPPEVIPVSANKYSGQSYYSAGDIIKRKRDNSIWMCVRPSSGPAKKDYSYWICLTPEIQGIIKTENKNLTNREGAGTPCVFAKKLISLKIAKAAIHTLNSLANSWITSDEGGFKNNNTVSTALRSEGYDVRNLVSNFSTEKQFTTAPGENKFYKSFFVAYGSPKKDGKRTTGATGNSQNKLVQPILTCKIGGGEGGNLKELMYTHITTASAANPKTETYLSLTDSYDEKYINSVKAKDAEKYLNLEDFKDAEPKNSAYMVDEYYQKAEPLGWRTDTTYLPAVEKKGSDEEIKKDGFNVLITPELKIKDHGNPAAGYTEIYRQRKNTGAAITSDDAFDYWTSLKCTTRQINGKYVTMSKEASE
ncbi:MAG: hypothetical protein IKS40_08815 [Treponema sp.]|nr:hypothetical protein [Treponema sp.]